MWLSKQKRLLRIQKRKNKDWTFYFNNEVMKVICFDTETTWFPVKDAPIWKQPFIIQRWQTCFDTLTFKDDTDFFENIDKLFKPNCSIPANVSAIHWIYDEHVKDADVFTWFLEDVVIPMFDSCDLIVAHNASFDMNMLYLEAQRSWRKAIVEKVLWYKSKVFCTMKTTTNLVKATWPMWFKRPKLQELHKYCFWHMFEDAHNAFADVEATWKCFVHLMNQWIFKIVDGTVQVFI